MNLAFNQGSIINGFALPVRKANFIYIYIYIYVCMYIYMHMHMDMYMYMYIYMHIYMHMHMDMHMYIYILNGRFSLKIIFQGQFSISSAFSTDHQK